MVHPRAAYCFGYGVEEKGKGEVQGLGHTFDLGCWQVWQTCSQMIRECCVMAWVGDCVGNALGGGGMALGTHLTWATGKSSNLVST